MITHIVSLKTFSKLVDHGLYHNNGGRRSPAVACWASDHWVASSNPLRGKFRHYPRRLLGPV